MHTHILHKQFLSPQSTEATRGTEPALPTRQRWLTIATADVDRAGDMLVLEGMDATNFLKNPQFLWQHGASGAQLSTIGKIVELRAQGNALYALAEYAAPEISPLAEQVYQMDLAGLLPANSIGFRPIEYEANEFGGYNFTQWELIECSKVELPMNPEAVDNGKFYSLEEAADWLLY
jgi:hypothetical protein